MHRLVIALTVLLATISVSHAQDTYCYGVNCSGPDSIETEEMNDNFAHDSFDFFSGVRSNLGTLDNEQKQCMIKCRDHHIESANACKAVFASGTIEFGDDQNTEGRPINNPELYDICIEVVRDRLVKCLNPFQDCVS